MCKKKPGPRCSYHAFKTFDMAKEKFSTALTLKDKEQAASVLKKAEQQLDSTTAGQLRLQTMIQMATRTEERELYKQRLLKGAKLRAQQETALQLNLPAETDVSSIEPCIIDSYIDENGDVLYKVMDSKFHVVGTVHSSESGKKEANALAWEYNQTVPYVYPETSIAASNDEEKRVGNWEKAENVNTARIHEMLPEGYRASREGASDSTVSDIAIKDANGNIVTYAEVKLEKAQSGQIVVARTDDNNFQKTNLDDPNPYSQKVIEIVNRQSETLKANSNGEPLKISQLSSEDQTTVLNWFKTHYADKNATFIAVTNNNLSYTSVFRLKDVEKHADITIAMPRAKKSGSAPLPLKSKEEATKAVTSLVRGKISQEGKYTYISTLQEPTELYYGPNKEYFLSHKGIKREKDGRKRNIYEIRKLATTENMTLMFNFEYKGTPKTQGKDTIRRWLKSREKRVNADS